MDLDDARGASDMCNHRFTRLIGVAASDGGKDGKMLLDVALRHQGCLAHHPLSVFAHLPDHEVDRLGQDRIMSSSSNRLVKQRVLAEINPTGTNLAFDGLVPPFEFRDIVCGSSECR